MTQIGQDELDKLLSSDDDLSDSDLDAGDAGLEDIFDDSEEQLGAEEEGVDFGLEDFSLEDDSVNTGSQTPQASSHNIDLLLDVELDVVVVLGRANRTIRQVLNFSPGTVVDLDKIAGETVDILVNNRLIATGEVVAFDQSLGVRIASIITPEELIKKLR